MGGAGIGGADVEVKLKGVEIALDEDLYIKVMGKEFLWKY